MRSEQLLDAMNGIDEKYLEESEKAVPAITHFPTRKVLAACACLALLVFGLGPVCLRWIDIPKGSGSASDTADTASEKEFDMAGQAGESESSAESADDSGSGAEQGFSMNGIDYKPAAADSLEYYGFGNVDNISGQERGTFIGTIAESQDEDLAGCRVYHVKEYEDSDDICLVEQDGVYRLYCKDEAK